MWVVLGGWDIILGGVVSGGVWGIILDERSERGEGGLVGEALFWVGGCGCG